MGSEESECELSFSFGTTNAVPLKSSGFSFGAPKMMCKTSSSFTTLNAAPMPMSEGLRCAKRSSRNRDPPKKIGTANAARVSRGTKVDTWSGLNIKTPKRNKNEHITCTIVIYNTITDGVPSENDITAAIDDMENLYNNCNE